MAQNTTQPDRTIDVIWIICFNVWIKVVEDYIKVVLFVVTVS